MRFLFGSGRLVAGLGRAVTASLNGRRNVLSVAFARQFSCSTSLFGSGRVYSKEHEWVTVENDSSGATVGRIGISDHAQDSLGELVYVQLPEIGQTTEQGEECGTLESVKAASELYCPVSGEVIDKNEQVEQNPKLVNEDCYNEGWLFKVRLSEPGQLDELMDEAAYEKFLAEND